MQIPGEPLPAEVADLYRFALGREVGIVDDDVPIRVFANGGSKIAKRERIPGQAIAVFEKPIVGRINEQ